MPLWNGTKSTTSIPAGLRWRSSTPFILVTVGLGMFTDLFLYGLITPVMPFMLQDHIGVPKDQVQGIIDYQLAIFAVCQVLMSPIAGIAADMVPSRKMPFLLGLVALLVGTLLLATGST